MFKRTSPSDISSGEIDPSEPRVYRKPRADAYTVLLSIVLIALVLASVTLWMVMKEYNYQIKGYPAPTWNRPAPAAVFDAPRGMA